MENNNSLGERIRYARKKKNFNQAKLSELIGRSVSMLRRYESDLKSPPSDVLGLISMHTDCSPTWLLTGEEDAPLSDSAFVVRDEDFEPDPYDFEGQGIYLPIVFHIPDDSEIASISEYYDDFLFLLRSKLFGNLRNHFAIQANTYFSDPLNSNQNLIFVIHRQNAINSGDLALVQFEGIPLIGKVFFGKKIASIQTDVHLPARIHIPPEQMEDLIIFGRVVLSIQDY